MVYLKKTFYIDSQWGSVGPIVHGHALLCCVIRNKELHKEVKSIVFNPMVQKSIWGFYHSVKSAVLSLFTLFWTLLFTISISFGIFSHNLIFTVIIAIDYCHFFSDRCVITKRTVFSV